MSDQSPDQPFPSDPLWNLLAESFLQDAREEIDRHKWIESERARRDLGQKAVEDWLYRFWWKFCRWRRLEHVEGTKLWREFHALDFAILRRIVMERELLDAIVNRMKGKDTHPHDNLEIIMWSLANANVSYQRVEEFLLLIDIDSARLPVPADLHRPLGK